MTNSKVTSDARYFIVDLVMSILRLHMLIFSPTTSITFTKLRFRQSFWGAQHVKILIGSKAMTKNKKVFISFFYHFVKPKAENLCLMNCHFKNHFWSFFGQLHTLESGIDVGQGPIGPGKFVKKNKRRAWTKCANLCYKNPIKLENICRPWEKFQKGIPIRKWRDTFGRGFANFWDYI